MRVGKLKLKMSDGSIHEFKSAKALSKFERVAKMVKHNPEFKEKLERKGR